MHNDHKRIPENWPQSWRKEYTSAMRKTPADPRESHLFNAATRHVEYCVVSNHPFLAYQSILEHRRELKCEMSSEIAGSYAFALVRIALKGPDKALRDQLHEHFGVRRTARQFLEAIYVPRQARLIGLRALELQEITRRDLAVFDLYLRVVDRLGDLPTTPSAIVSAFWQHPPESKHQCAILGKAAAMIDLMLPGHIDANTLRTAQRARRVDTNQPVRRCVAHPEIHALVESARQIKRSARGRPYSKKKKSEQRSVLRRLKAV